jgi:transposase
MNNTSISKNYVGVDVSKDFLDIYIHPSGESYRISNTKKEIGKLFKKLKTYNIEQIVCESSGGYEFLLLEIARKNSSKVWQVEPKRIRAFIVSEGIKAKTDKIDARMIALFASKKEPAYSPIEQSKEEAELKALSMRRADLQQIIVMEKNRLKHPQQEYSKESISKHIDFMELEVEEIDKKAEQIITSNKTLNTNKVILESIPGVGKVTALALLSCMPEIGKIENNQIASLLGVAPFDNQSGQFKGKSSIRGGRRHVRKVVYMASISAVRFNPPIKELYERLRNKGKPTKVASVASMRKLVTIANTMVKNGTTWQNTMDKSF